MTAAATPHFVHARAPGKVNLFLRVGDVMDDGYHEVANLYQAVSLYEEVRAFPADDISATFSGPIDASGIPGDARNLAVKAARLLARRTGYKGGVRLEIVKHVPVAGGMAGGSADAAATLIACDALWGTERSRDDLLVLAGRLGADVPFALTGGTALGTHRGELLSPVLAQGVFHWVLVISEAGLSTPLVYAELDRQRERSDSAAREAAVPRTAATRTATRTTATHAAVADPDVLQALRAGDARMLAAALSNDLQASALHLQPALRDILERGESNGALAGIVSGSGPTLAFLCADLDSSLDLQVTLSASGLNALHVTGPVHGARVLA